MTPSDLARKLALARSRGSIAALDPSDTIANVEEAYRVQAELAALEKDGVRGWKVTALTAPEQTKFSSSRPVAGELLGQYVHAGPTCVALSNMILPLLECEVAFTLAVDLPAQNLVAFRHPMIPERDRKLSGGPGGSDMHER